MCNPAFWFFMINVVWFAMSCFKNPHLKWQRWITFALFWFSFLRSCFIAVLLNILLPIIFVEASSKESIYLTFIFYILFFWLIALILLVREPMQSWSVHHCDIYSQFGSHIWHSLTYSWWNLSHLPISVEGTENHHEVMTSSGVCTFTKLPSGLHLCKPLSRSVKLHDIWNFLSSLYLQICAKLQQISATSPKVWTTYADFQEGFLCPFTMSSYLQTCHYILILPKCHFKFNYIGVLASALL